MSWLCTLAGHNDHWIDVGNYRVRVCRRCPHVTNVIVAQQWPPNPIVGYTTTTYDESW